MRDATRLTFVKNGGLHGAQMGEAMRPRSVALVLILFAVVMFPLLDSGQARALALQRPPSARLPDGVGHPIEHLHRRLGRSSSWGTVSSQSWAGYDATGGGFTSVTGSWVEPSIQVSYSAETYAAFWVGLDGHGSSTVEQTGTVAYSESGSVSYYAWYEMYPDAAIPINGMTVSPGDEMTGTVTSDGMGDFTLSLVDHTTHHSFTTTQTNGVTAPFSAEVIAEAPSSAASGPTFQLADFGSVDFTNCAFNGQPISAFAYNEIDMVSAGNVTEAVPSALGADGASFSVTSYPAGDSTPPVTVAPGYDDAWRNSAVQVTLIAADNAGGSGVKSITYSIDGGVPTTVDAAVTQVTIGAPANHSDDGVHTLSFYSTDNDGNQETAKSVVVKIDTVAPTMSVSGASDGAWLNHAATITLSDADNAGGSGVASIRYTLDGAVYTVAGASTQVVLPASPNATHTLTYQATDLAGNVSADQNLSVHIDTVGPTTIAKLASGHKGKAIALKCWVSDTSSPRATSVTLTIRNSHKKVVKTFKLQTKKVSAWYAVKWRPKVRGTYRYTVTAKDLAGNKQTKAGSAKITVKKVIRTARS